MLQVKILKSVSSLVSLIILVALAYYVYNQHIVPMMAEQNEENK